MYVCVTISLLVAHSTSSLLPNDLLLYTNWIRRLMEQRNLWIRWFPWFQVIGLTGPARRLNCPRNETYVLLGRPCGMSCGTYGQFCPIVKVNSCICIRGHVRNLTGICIHYTECPKTMDDVEILH
uniref:TIL domain-containing protein n=1 Tax=Anopheles albimanus TaxID=7167 RepID=A0A182FS80_ANOAL